MKVLLAMSALTLSSLAAATPNPCTLFTPNDVGLALGITSVTSKPDPDQDFPTCRFNYKNGALMVQLITPAHTYLKGNTLLAFALHGAGGGSGFKGIKPVAGLGNEAVGTSSEAVNTVGSTSVVVGSAVMLVRKGDTLMLMIGTSLNRSAFRLNAQRLAVLAKRALSHLP
ncbi:hypothetical protein E7T06_05020 [Deinococcus sp. Arct2-2]|uniref:hypothetical protein n=1 Tax=Deinococcus sp. Arct2-2 TaxID=2568653 RepID=UPI0010A36569|nr:hypothetical protein [Deinococcus sp. Arct2-2]THF70924.1 hypothetical protein E7T06_05020 [Deinococcus sp. Arct2-2]